jgi:hypothetical protein
MFRGSVLACAALFCLPSMWQSTVMQAITVDTLMIRFVIAVPLSAVLLGLVRLAMRRGNAEVEAAAEARATTEAAAQVPPERPRVP